MLCYTVAMTYRYIDTHAHLNLAQFAEDLGEVLDRCTREEVAMINVGTHKVTSEKAVAIAQQSPHAWAIIGVHPCNVLEADPDDLVPVVEPTFDYKWYKALAAGERVVGIGECGFDWFHNPVSAESYEAQREVFEAQIALANELGKPLMLHLRNSRESVAAGGRDAYDDALAVLRQQATVPVNAHFYAGTTEQAKQFFDLGGTISFTGVITFARKHYEELVAYAPLDRIHVETDCPYVAPIPYRGQRAEPWMVMETLKTIADIKQLDEETVRQILLQNAYILYKL